TSATASRAFWTRSSPGLGLPFIHAATPSGSVPDDLPDLAATISAAARGLLQSSASIRSSSVSITASNAASRTESSCDSVSWPTQSRAESFSKVPVTHVPRVSPSSRAYGFALAHDRNTRPLHPLRHVHHKVRRLADDA